MNILNLDSKLDLDKIDKEIEQNRIKLERLISSEDANSTAIDELEKSVEQINEILLKLNLDKRTDSNKLLEK